MGAGIGGGRGTHNSGRAAAAGGEVGAGGCKPKFSISVAHIIHNLTTRNMVSIVL